MIWQRAAQATQATAAAVGRRVFLMIKDRRTVAMSFGIVALVVLHAP
jgi:hypothetical protein